MWEKEIEKEKERKKEENREFCDASRSQSRNGRETEKKWRRNEGKSGRKSYLIAREGLLIK